MNEKEIRAVFIKHSMEKNPELELFDTDAIIKDLAALIASYSREARIETLQQVLSNQFHTFQPVGGISNIQYIARSDVDRQLKTLKEAKQNLSEVDDE